MPTKTGCFLNLDCIENIQVALLSTGKVDNRGFVNQREVNRLAEEYAEKLRVKTPNLAETVANLSGGNQQKIVVAREISAQPDILLVGQPTRGVDIGAIEFIHKQLLGLRDRGCAVILVSVELDEILTLSDRIMVMNAGQNMGILKRQEADIQKIGRMMAGIEHHAPSQVPA